MAFEMEIVAVAAAAVVAAAVVVFHSKPLIIVEWLMD